MTVQCGYDNHHCQFTVRFHPNPRRITGLMNTLVPLLFSSAAVHQLLMLTLLPWRIVTMAHSPIVRVQQHREKQKSHPHRVMPQPHVFLFLRCREWFCRKAVLYLCIHMSKHSDPSKSIRDTLQVSLPYCKHMICIANVMKWK